MRLNKNTRTSRGVYVRYTRRRLNVYVRVTDDNGTTILDDTYLRLEIRWRQSRVFPVYWSNLLNHLYIGNI